MICTHHHHTAWTKRAIYQVAADRGIPMPERTSIQLYILEDYKQDVKDWEQVFKQSEQQEAWQH